jgi:hypothetical protein
MSAMALWINKGSLCQSPLIVKATAKVAIIMYIFDNLPHF